MKGLQTVGAFLGRLFMSLIFIMSAVNKIIDWQNTERGFVSLLCDWHSYVSFSMPLQKFFAVLLPWVPFILIIATVIELIGGILLLLGYKVRLGVFLLLIFFIPTTILFHQFWFLEGLRRDMQFVIFFKNIAIMGGLLYVLAFGAKKSNSSEFPSNTSIDNPHLGG